MGSRDSIRVANPLSQVFNAAAFQCPAPATPYADVVVVPTGGSGRLRAALIEMVNNQNPNAILYISGLGSDTLVMDALRATFNQPGDIPPERWPRSLLNRIMGDRAADTAENGSKTAEFIAANNFSRVTLVTSESHMARMQNELEYYLDFNGHRATILTRSVEDVNMGIAQHLRNAIVTGLDISDNAIRQGVANIGEALARTFQ